MPPAAKPGQAPDLTRPGRRSQTAERRAGVPVTAWRRRTREPARHGPGRGTRQMRQTGPDILGGSMKIDLRDAIDQTERLLAGLRELDGAELSDEAYTRATRRDR